MLRTATFAEEADDDIGEPQATFDPLAVSPTLYDGADDDEFAEPTPKAPRKKRVPKAAPAQSETAPVPAAPVKPGEWHLPSMAMLEKAGEQSVDMKSVEARGATLQESLSQHGVDTQLVGFTVGPTVTRYELELGPGVKVAKVTSLQKDIAYAMAATDVRILAPILAALQLALKFQMPDGNSLRSEIFSSLKKRKRPHIHLRLRSGKTLQAKQSF